MSWKSMRIFAGLALATFGGIFLLIGARQVAYPGFTEPMEGDVLAQVERIRQGLSPYPLPGSEFIALALMPLFHFLAVPFTALVGVDRLGGPRLLSAVCSLLSAGLVAHIAWMEGRSRWAAALAAAFFFSSYRVMDACLMSGLPDSLMLLCVLLGLRLWAYGRSAAAEAGWILCFGLAFWAKQQGVLYLLLAAGHTLVTRRGRLPWWALLGGCAVVGPLAYALIGPHLGEGFFLHTQAIPSHWERSATVAFRRSVFVVACLAPFAALLALVWLRAAMRRDAARPLAWFLIGSLILATISMSVTGSSNNHYVPFLALLGCGAALGLREMVEADWPRRLGVRLWVLAAASAAVFFLARHDTGHHPVNDWVPLLAAGVAAAYSAIRLARVAMPARAVLAAMLLGLAQFAAVGFDPRDFLPRPGFEAGLADLRGELNTIPGDWVWAEYGCVPPSFTGRAALRTPSWVALEDVERQEGYAAEAARELAPFRARIRAREDLFVLCNGPLEDLPGWTLLAGRFRRVKDYGTRFSAVRQIAAHWFGGGSYPRYLYRETPFP